MVLVVITAEPTNNTVTKHNNKINQMATAPDSQRPKPLREIAITRA